MFYHLITPQFTYFKHKYSEEIKILLVYNCIKIIKRITGVILIQIFKQFRI